MQGTVLQDVDVTYLDNRWLDYDGRIKLLSAEEFRKVPHNDLRVWMHKRARYSLPTLELVEWLKKRIGGRKAVEVGCGNGDLYHHLGIPGTDSCGQRNPAVRVWYALHGQIPTNPREEVIPLSAEQVVLDLKPKVVVASYLTRKFIEGKDVEGKAQASVMGAVEENIIMDCDCYIHIGNQNSHGEKTILSQEHEEFTFPWLVTRGDPSKDVIYVWGR